MEPAVKKRENNWTKDEKDALFQVVQKYLDIIENKSVATNMNIKKNNAWKEIHNDFYSRVGNTRTLERLREQWKRMKTKAKTNVSNVKKHWKKTGGGGPPAPPPTEDHEYLPTNKEESKRTCEVTDIDWAIAHALPQDFTKDKSTFDSDFINQINDGDDFSAEAVDDVVAVENEVSGSCFVSAELEMNGSSATPPNSKGKSVFSKKQKRQKVMTPFEEEMLALNKRKYDLEIENMIELHTLEVEKKKLEIENLRLKNSIILKDLQEQ